MTLPHAPATARNREPIFDVLHPWLRERPRVLEIASGTGEHAAYFTSRAPHLRWQPTDISPEALAAIEAHRAATGHDRIDAPLILDTRRAWPADRYDAVLCINMIHISPWDSAEALFRGVGKVLHEQGIVYFYGPFRRAGEALAPSNVSFEGWLKERDPRNGIRELEAVAELASQAGLRLAQVTEMPANNLSVVFAASGAEDPGRP